MFQSAALVRHGRDREFPGLDRAGCRCARWTPLTLKCRIRFRQLGGDGTVLFTSWLFQRIVPPVLPFALGSLGFLTNFDFADYAKTLDKAVDDGIRVNLRMRFTCTVYRAVTPEQAAVATCKKRKAIKSTGGDILLNQVDAEGWEALEGTRHDDDDKKTKAKRKKDKEIMCFSTRPVETFEVLNDLVVDRGPSPYVSLLELFGKSGRLPLCNEAIALTLQFARR